MSKQDIKKELAKFCDTAKPQSITFAGCSNATIKDMSSRNANNTRSLKALKFPRNSFDQRLLDQIDYGKLAGNSYQIYLDQINQSNMVNIYKT
jgi:hypothetical protein